MADKLTSWYPPEVKPVRNGVYERDMQGRGARFSYWTGKWWGGWADTKKAASTLAQRAQPSSVQDANWRGLAQPT